MTAYTKYQSLISCISVAEEFVQFSNTAMTAWMIMIGNELELIKGIMASDSIRYKNLPD